MKKIILPIVTFALMWMLAACGGQEEVQTDKTTTNDSDVTKNQVVFVIEAKNWELSPTELKVEKGDEVTITLESVEGYHGVTIEGYDVEIQPGKSVTFIADETGTFVIKCSIPCGEGHEEMMINLVVA